MTVAENPNANSAPFPWVGLSVLAAGVFLSVTSETIPTGLLPDMSHTLDVSEAQIGLLVTVFAFTVVATSAVLTALTKRMPRHGLIVLVLIVLGASNVLTALSPTYPIVVATRILGALAHGLFWSVVVAYAGHLVPTEKISRAVSITLGGGTLAFVIGVPLGTAVGHAFGWRLTFALVGALMIAGAVLVWRFLPRVGRTAASGTTADASRDSGRPARDPTIRAVVIVCVIAALTMIGQYSFYTYFAPFLIQQVGIPVDDIGLLLFFYGIAGAAGLLLAGWVFGPRPRAGLVISLAATGVAVVVLGAFAGSPWLAIAAFLAWGLAFGALPPLIQTRLLHAASPELRDTASAFYTTAFNVGIGGGALVGAIVFDTVGLPWMPYIYAGLLAAVLVLVLVDRVDRVPSEPVTPRR